MPIITLRFSSLERRRYPTSLEDFGDKEIPGTPAYDYFEGTNEDDFFPPVFVADEDWPPGDPM